MSDQLINYIKTLIPLCDIKKENTLNDLFKNILLGKMPANRTLFYSGRQNEFTYYLLSGQVTLIDANNNQSLLHSEDPRCRFPVGYDQSHKYTVQTDSAINYLKINSQTLDVLLTWDQTTSPLVREPVKAYPNDDTSNWMSKILELKLFQRIPPINIQAMFLRFESLRFEKDERVIEQGSAADYYYVIKSGTAAVYRAATDNTSSQDKIAELGPGEAFGEEALVADSPRNASIIMQEPGELARLSKADFIELLKKPVIASISYPEALALLATGATFIDTRTTNEYQHNQLANSLNIPLVSLREQLSQFDNNHAYIVYCDTGSRSAAACFILNGFGFEAYLLENGLNEVPSDAILHPNES